MRNIPYLPGMRKICFLGLWLVLFSMTGTAGPIRDTAALRRAIMAVYARQPQAEFALAFEDLSTGQQFFINEHENFHAASTMKTPVLIETFRLIASGRLSLQDSILVHTDFISIADSSRYRLDSADDSETEMYRLAGQRLPLRQLLYKMITESSEERDGYDAGDGRQRYPSIARRRRQQGLRAGDEQYDDCL